MAPWWMRPLRTQLQALVAEIGAADAAIIDSASPIVWCCAHGEATSHARTASEQLVMTPQLQQAIRLLQLSRLELIEEIRRECEANPVLDDEAPPAPVPAPAPPPPADVWTPAETRLHLRAAILRVRETRELREVPKGATFEHVDDANRQFVAFSFAAIYVLVVVAPRDVDLHRTRQAFDARRAEIEALVSALSLPSSPA